MVLLEKIVLATGLFSSITSASELPTAENTLRRRDVSSSTYSKWFPSWNKHRGDGNAMLPSDLSGTVSDEKGYIRSSQSGKDLVNTLSNAQGGFLRVQIPIEEFLNNANYGDDNEHIFDVLTAVMQEASDKGIYVLVCLRGSGGGVLTGDSLNDAVSVTKSLVNTYKGYKNFMFNTYNEPIKGGFTYDDYANMMETLIGTARDEGFEGFIFVEESHWGGGWMDAQDSGIAWWAERLQDANGGNFNNLVASIHAYISGSKDSAVKTLWKEVNAITDLGMLPAITEYGNANYGACGNGNEFEKRQAGLEALRSEKQNLLDAGVIGIPWFEFLSDDAPSCSGNALRGYGYGNNEQIFPDTQEISGPPTSPFDW